jgi:hypothetical protein
MSEKWWDMSDDELDDLFREASDKADTPFNQLAFDKLRQKIDFKPIPPTTPQGGFKKRWLALVALLIFFGGTLLYTFFNKKDSSIPDNQQNIISEKEIPSSMIDKNLGKTIENKSTNQSQTTPELTNNKAEITDAKTPILNEKRDIPNSVKSKTIASKSIISEVNSPKNEEIETVNSKSDISKNNSVIVEKSIAKKRLGFSKKEFSTKEFSTNDSESILNDKSFKNKPLYNSDLKKFNKKVSTASVLNHDYTEQVISFNDNLSSENKEENITKTNFYNVDFISNKATKPISVNFTSESPTYVATPPVPVKQPKPSRFGIRLALAPDINSLDRIGTSALGSSLGLLLEYRIGKRWVVQTGIAYSTKKYVSGFDSYNNWKTNWKSYHPSKPVEVDGGCKVFDLPINLRLNIYQKPRTTFFVSSGISSYFMMNETYTYQYANTPERTVTWNDESSFYWSTLNISAGFEKKLNKHFNFQVEPYLKTPLTNVGRGGVSLYSSGLLFSTKYEF